MDAQKQELVEKLKGANNILVTVSSNPSVDQLAACIGLTILLNKLKKHATAVFSGTVPSTIEFLKPEETIEKNTDSLRDFIISLDKSKADKLRYKVEENIVKIFITPYKTSITQDDLDFSQGDFNVDVVLCLGINQQQDLDQAITAHGRILHDAVVASINTHPGSELGTINWTDPGASSLSELATEVADALGKDLVDGQIATALLTGIVAETDRFSNEKTSPNTMKLSAELMSAGANQQLVANELQSGAVVPAAAADQPSGTEISVADDGTLEIGHPAEAQEPSKEEESHDEPPTDVAPPTEAVEVEGEEEPHAPASRVILQPPSLGGTLTANSTPESFDPSVDPLTMLTSDAPMLNHDRSSEPQVSASEPHEPAADKPAPLELPEVAPPEPDQLAAPDAPSYEPLPSEPQQPAAADDAAKGQSLTDLEASVHSPHAAATGTATEPVSQDLDAARDAVLNAINSAPITQPLAPKADVGASGYLNVQDLPDIASDGSMAPSPLATTNEPAPGAMSPADQPMNMPLPPSFTMPAANPEPPTSTSANPSAPPPVPPPIPFDDLSKFTPPQQ